VQEQLECNWRARLRKLSPRDERSRERGDVQGGGESNVGGLAKLARGVVLPAVVDVGGGKNDKQQGANGQRERQNNPGVPPSAAAPVLCDQISPSRARLDAGVYGPVSEFAPAGACTSM